MFNNVHVVHKMSTIDGPSNVTIQYKNVLLLCIGVNMGIMLTIGVYYLLAHIHPFMERF